MNWTHPHGLPELRGGVHVWLAEAGEWAAEDLLSPEERARADRFAFPELRTRYIFHHAVLRTLLGRYLGREAAAIEFGATPLGKPYLVGGELHFNMSHCRSVGLFAFGPRELGVDVEGIRPMTDAIALARRYFTPFEQQAVCAEPDVFFTCWTRKEAVLKATGEGLHRELNSIDVLGSLRVETTPGRVYTIRDLPEAAGCAAAIAVEGELPPLDCWLFQAP